MPPERPASTTDTPTAAIIGLAGVVVGALLTQLFAVWREKRQWARQVEHDNQRWEQEREERKEQWAREDESRWHQERLAAYSALLTSLEGWIRLARKIRPRAYLGQREISREDAELLEAVIDEIQNAALTVELLAPEPIRGRVRALYVSTSFFRIDFSHNIRERTPQEAEDEASATIEKVVERRNDLRKLIRQELRACLRW